MTRFAGEFDILNKVKNLQDLRSEGSIDYLTPYMSSQRPPTYGSGGTSYFDYIEDKRKELDDIVNSDGGPWKKPDEDVKPVDPDPDPVTPDPEPEIDPERKAAQDKWRKIFANHIEEGNRKGRSEIDSMDMAVRYSKVMTPEENREYKWAFQETTNAPDWRKWGGGRKKGSGGGVRKAGEKSGPGLGFHVGQAVRGIKARFSPTQGKVGGGKNNKSTKGGTTAPGNQGAGAMRSDIQLKENITYINTSPEGHSIYEWNYKGEPESRRYQGVMAQELLETVPHAVVIMDDGYLGVKYDEIDVEFTTA
jgi:hypothetical protein